MSITFIDQHRDIYGVEPICRVLPIAPSTYFRHKLLARDPAHRSTRTVSDAVLRAIIRQIWDENHRVYGPRKVWKQMGREGLRLARCRVRRLMREMGLIGASRGRAWITTTHSRPEVDRPRDLVDRRELRRMFFLSAWIATKVPAGDQIWPRSPPAGARTTRRPG